MSEREVTAPLARYAGYAGRVPVADAMIHEPLTVTPDTSVMAAIAIMTARRARHVPVLLGGRIVGMLSIGDVLKSRLDEKTLKDDVLHDITRWPRAV